MEAWPAFFIIIAVINFLLATRSRSSGDTAWQENADCHDDSDEHCINPATGLPMIGGMGGVDTSGNPFGSGTLDDSFGSSLHDDSFGSGTGDIGMGGMGDPWD